jgi:hypothetical protein
MPFSDNFNFFIKFILHIVVKAGNPFKSRFSELNQKVNVTIRILFIFGIRPE